jgi:polysaccharide pyruvyl transferase WcaK-like protein
MLIKNKMGKKIFIQHVSHRFLSPFFYNEYVSPIISKKNIWPFYYKKNGSIEENHGYKKWIKAYKEMYSKDIFLNLTLKNADFVIINIEGTVHHQSLLGHQMLAIGKLAFEFGKKVYWVNFSTQSENETILKDALYGAQKIATREVRSYSYLKSLGINVTQAFDTAVLADYNNEVRTFNNRHKEEYCLFTGSNIKKYNLLEIASVVKENGYEPIYLPLGLNDFNELKSIKDNNIKHLNFNDFTYNNINEVINKSKFIVSGRHHLNIFSLLANKPFIPLKSNTWKIEGVCEMLDYKSDFEMNLSNRIISLMKSYSFIEESFKESVPKLKKLSSNNL